MEDYMSYQPQQGQPQGSTSNTLSTLAIIFGGISFLFLPIILGPVAIVLAIIAKTKHESRSTIALIVSILGLVIGMVLGAVVFASTMS